MRTIAALSTAPGTGGIAVIRMSGDRAVAIADKVFRGKDSLSGAPTHTIHYGFIQNSAGEKIDEVLVSVMRAPRTFTREDVIEISTHGGQAAPNAVLDALLAAGAYPAEAGEFTKRAFMNGRIDLSQAEAVIDMISAENPLARRSALSQIEGSLSDEIHALRAELVNLAARMQVAIDYPDEDLEDITPDEILDVLKTNLAKTERLIASADSGALVKSGIKTVIAGKPNVGKSSLLNALARADRAIVTDVAGTTRDVIEEKVTVDGIPLLLADTAGIRDTADKVEKIGVEKSKKLIDEADLVIVMTDGSGFFDDEDRAVLRATRRKKRIVLINKTDLGQSKYAASIRSDAKESAVIEVSARTGEGLDRLSGEIRRMFNTDALTSYDGAVVTNLRHKSALIKAREAIERAVNTLTDGLPQDIAALDISAAMDALGEITGETVSDSVVSEIFHNFCVGK